MIFFSQNEAKYLLIHDWKVDTFITVGYIPVITLEVMIGHGITRLVKYTTKEASTYSR